MLSKEAGGAEFDYRQAQYGPGVATAAGGAPQPIAVADPFDGCDDKAYKVLIECTHKPEIFFTLHSGILPLFELLCVNR